MSKPNEIRQQFLTGERALFQACGLNIFDTIFDDGESPLKESRNTELWDSVLNPSGGTIKADSIGELSIEKDKVAPGKTVIICRDAIRQAG